MYFVRVRVRSRSIFPVHPSFRVLALAEPPVVGSSGQQWLGPELLTMFLFHSVQPLARAQEGSLITGLVTHTHTHTQTPFTDRRHNKLLQIENCTDDANVDLVCPPPFSRSPESKGSQGSSGSAPRPYTCPQTDQ